jgi:hypothetical protein
VPKVAKKTLDTFPQKRGRGRPEKVSSAAVSWRADSYRGIFGHVWDELWPILSSPQSEEDVIRAFKTTAQYGSEIATLAPLIFTVLTDSRFPKRKQAQINFLADSIGGVGIVTPRSSRDICARERARARRSHHIIAIEQYVICSCTYKGPSEGLACPECGAKIPDEWLDASNY